MGRDLSYQETLFDRRGPDATLHLRSWSYGLAIALITFLALLLLVGYHWWILPIAGVSGVGCGALGLAGGAAIGRIGYNLAISGSSTPYVEQYSLEQALVIKGEIDNALARFERIIATDPSAVRPKIQAAELYTRGRQNHERAAELFREVQRMPSLSKGDDVYVTNRLVDLLLGPLSDAERALVELRRLVRRHPDSAAAAHARKAIGEIETRVKTIR